MKINSFKFKKQTGAALLIAMVVLASMAAFYLLGQLGGVSQKQTRQDNRVAALAQAKKALIASAVTYIDSHPGEYGFLPCPDQTGAGILFEGEQESLCSGNQYESVIGRLPWRTLDLPPLKDHANECLWYAVSGPYKHTNGPGDKSAMLNEDTNGLFQVYDAAGNLIYGANPEERVVAVVLAAGRPLAGQTRTPDVPAPAVPPVQCGGHYTVFEYLEGNGDIDNASLDTVVNPDSVDRFIKAGTNSGQGANPYNDRLITITRDEIWDAVKRRGDFQTKLRGLTTTIANCIRDYGNTTASRNLPWSAVTDLGNTDYRIDTNYTDSVTAVASVLGRLPNQVDNSEAQLDSNGGGGIPGTTVAAPPSCTACENEYQDYIEELAEILAEFNLDVAEANADYATCSRSQAWCDRELARELEDAQDDYDRDIARLSRTGRSQGELTEYNSCLAANSCTVTGGGTVADCGACDTNYDNAVTAADSQLATELADIQATFLSCRRSARRCESRRDEDIEDANEDYAKDIAEAQALKDVCLASNSCGGSGGSKGIDYVLFNPANPAAFGTCLGGDDQKLWQHWKDHFFFVPSGDFAPDSPNATCNGNCVTTTNGNEHAAIVLFSGSRVAPEVRNGPVVTGDPVVVDDVDTKQTISNYLSTENDGSNTVYDPVPGAVNANDDADFLVCLDEGANVGDPLTVTDCN